MHVTIATARAGLRRRHRRRQLEGHRSRWVLRLNVPDRIAFDVRNRCDRHLLRIALVSGEISPRAATDWPGCAIQGKLAAAHPSRTEMFRLLPTALLLSTLAAATMAAEDDKVPFQVLPLPPTLGLPD